MEKLWCSIVLAFVLFGFVCLVSFVREQVFAQQYPVAVGPVAPQVVVSPESPAQKYFADFTTIIDPSNPGKQLKSITIVDLESKTILVYHQDLAMGTVKLVSTRDIHPDILLGEFNAIKPTPREIEAEIRRLKKTN